MKSAKKKPHASELAKQVGRALKRAGKQARKVARMHGTPIYYVENGKIIAAKP
jgi:hypothetical protein